MIEQKLHFTLSLLCVCVGGGGFLLLLKAEVMIFQLIKMIFLYFYGFIESWVNYNKGQQISL